VSAIAELKALFGIDTKQAEKAIDNIGNKIKSLGSNQLAGLKGMIAGAFSVGAVVALGKSLMNTASEIMDTSEALNVSTESLQALKAKAAEAGVKFEDLQGVMGRITRAQAEALTGNEKMITAFTALGIPLKDLKEIGVDEIMQRIGVAFKDGGRSAEETAASFDIMGRGSARLMGFLESMADTTIPALISRYKELGMVIDEAYIKKLDQAEKTTERGITIIRNRLIEGIGGMITLIEGFAKGKSLEEILGEQAHLASQTKKKREIFPEAIGETPAEAEKMKRWYNLEEKSRLGKMSIMGKIGYYQEEVAKLREAELREPGDIDIKSDIREREEKIRDLIQANEKAHESYEQLNSEQDEVMLGWAEKQKDLLQGKGTPLGKMSRVDNLQAIGGIIGGAGGGLVDIAARNAERQTEISKELKKEAEKVNDKLTELNRKIDKLAEVE
jgi:hypothetical protein